MRKPDPALLRLLIFLGGLTAAVVLLLVFRDIFLPLLLGLGLAYVFDPAVSWFERHGRSRTFGVIVMALAMVGVLAGLVLFIVPTVSDQVERLAERLPEYNERLREQIEPWLGRMQTRYPDEIAEVQERVVQGIRDNLPQVAQSVGRWIRSLFSNVFEFFLFLLNLIFVPVFAFYLLVDYPKVKAGMAELIPVAYREVTLARLREVDSAVSSFLRGQLTIGIILAVINATGLMLLRVPFGLVIGLIAGLANMIPYMALVVGLAPAVVLCWAEHQSWVRVLGVVAVFGGAQLLEGTVLGPRILSRQVNLHPVWVLLAIIAGGSLFGFFGMLIAVPLAAAVQVFVRHWLEIYKRSRVYREPGSAPAGD